jgi:hypothetical protein
MPCLCPGSTLYNDNCGRYVTILFYGVLANNIAYFGYCYTGKLL